MEGSGSRFRALSPQDILKFWGFFGLYLQQVRSPSLPHPPFPGFLPFPNSCRSLSRPQEMDFRNSSPWQGFYKLTQEMSVLVQAPQVSSPNPPRCVPASRLCWIPSSLWNIRVFPWIQESFLGWVLPWGGREMVLKSQFCPLPSPPALRANKMRSQ